MFLDLLHASCWDADVAVPTNFLGRMKWLPKFFMAYLAKECYAMSRRGSCRAEHQRDQSGHFLQQVQHHTRTLSSKEQLQHLIPSG